MLIPTTQQSMSHNFPVLAQTMTMDFRKEFGKREQELYALHENPEDEINIVDLRSHPSEVAKTEADDGRLSHIR